MVSARPIAVAVGLVADRVLGEPPTRVHPVALFGRAMQAAERWGYADSRGAGVAYTALGVGAAGLTGLAATGLAASALAASGLAASAVGASAVGATGLAATGLAANGLAANGLAANGLAAPGRWPRRRGLGLGPVVGASTYLVVAGRELGVAAMAVAHALEAAELDAARSLLPALVGRDPTSLDVTEIARAVVESVAENTVDAIVAPALWSVAGGPAGALAYRAANTLDAMVGHHSARYERFGWASARLDDVANWIPARICAALVAAVRPAAAAAVWRTVLRGAPEHPSPNAGVAEAAFAAALGVRLGGTNRYGERIEARPELGDGRAPRPSDVARAVRLSRDVTAALVAGLVLAAVPMGRTGR